MTTKSKAATTTTTTKTNAPKASTYVRTEKPAVFSAVHNQECWAAMAVVLTDAAPLGASVANLKAATGFNHGMFNYVLKRGLIALAA